MSGFLAGRWVQPTITGTRTLVIDGVEFHIPEDAEVKTVTASGMRTVAHVRHDREVIVLSAQGQFDESIADARSRATANNWSEIAA